MNGFIKYFAGFVFCGCSFGVFAVIEQPQSVKLGVIDVIPLLKTGVSHDSNIFDNGVDKGLKNKSSTIYQLDPSVEFRVQNGLSIYSATLKANQRTYSSVRDAGYTDYGINGSLFQDFNSRNRLNFDLGYGVYHDSGSMINGSKNKKRPEYKALTSGFLYGFGSKQAQARIDIFGGITDSDYQKTNGVKEGADKSTKEIGSTLYYKLMPKTDLLLEVKQKNLEFDDKIKDGKYKGQQPGYDVASYLLGLKWEATAKTSGFTKIGRRYRDSKLKGVDKESFTGWEAGVNYMPLSYSTFELSTARDYGFVSDDPSSTSFTKGTTSKLGWNHDWTSKISTNTFYSYCNETVEAASGVKQKDRVIKTFGLGTTWKVRRNFNLSLNWKNQDHNESNVSIGNSKNDYKKNVYSLVADMSF